ncbi:hypothetical protein R1sor_015817 [Riccia sorocarpa]|uniref:WAT1-related protein n=1 Tax=Riccia sorocarpa TaxID=122646 RepID=A0ABD3HD96_9MARC
MQNAVPVITFLMALLLGLKQLWAIQKGGPLLVSLYTRVQTIIVAILSMLVQGDSLYLGSVVGGIRAVSGLYLGTRPTVLQTTPISPVLFTFDDTHPFLSPHHME